MSAKTWLGATLLIALQVFAAAAEEAKTAFKPNDVEVCLRDGSIVRGELRGGDELGLKTPYGTLTFPAQNLVTLRPGQRAVPQDTQKIEASIKDLDNDDFAKRNEAQRKLEALEPAALETLQQACKNASAETRNRIEAVIKKITAKSGGKLPQTDDIVLAENFQAQGTLLFETLTIGSRVGDLSVKLSDVQSVRWLSRGSSKNLTVDAESGLHDWVDTGVDVSPGEKVSVLASGSITLFNSGNSSGPAGTRNWNNGRNGMLTGSLIGKLGANGKSFLIGCSKQWVPGAKERLFVRMYCPDNVISSYGGQSSSGEYTLRIATGTWADNKTSAASADENPDSGD